MANLFLKIPVQNESSTPLKIYLEPLSEYFIVQSGEKVEVHAIFDEKTNNLNFTVAPNDSFLTIYAPGEVAGFVDCFATHNGVRLVPDGN
jgi:hypothetical protein